MVGVLPTSEVEDRAEELERERGGAHPLGGGPVTPAVYFVCYQCQPPYKRLVARASPHGPGPKCPRGHEMGREGATEVGEA